MGGKLRNLAFVACLPISVQASAQFTLAGTPADPPQQLKIELSGKAAHELIPLQDGRFTIPLRHGHVYPRSDSVELDGRRLEKDKEYGIDYTSGTVYLKVPTRTGQSIRVTYRYDDKKNNQGVSGGMAGSGNAFTFTFAPGAKAVIGMGYTERMADGSQFVGNVFGMANSFKFAGGGVSGVLMLNKRERSNSTDLYGNESSNNQDQGGTGVAILQNLDAGMLGGRLRATYQDVEEKFGAFGALSDAGIDQGTVNAIAGERGLKRTSIQLSDAGTKDVKVGLGISTVGDSNGSITWRNSQFSIGGAKVSYSSSHVDSGFTKFNGLREEDKKQLAKERGLLREQLNFAAPYKGFGLTYDWLKVTDDQDSFWRSGLGLDTGWFKGAWSHQEVSTGFSRFNDLREGDRGQLAKEKGVTRDVYSFNATSSGIAAAFAQNSFANTDSDWAVRSASITGKNFQLSKTSLHVSDGFNAFGSLTGEDRNLMLSAVATMFGAAAKPNGNDIGQVFRSEGLDRDSYTLSFNSGGWVGNGFNAVVNSGSGATSLTEISVAKGGTTVEASIQKTDPGFAETNRLTPTELAHFGRVEGLDKFAFKFNTKLFGGTVTANLLDATTPNGSAKREQLSIQQKNFSLTYSNRAVDKEFTNVHQLVDPEARLLHSILGFDQTEVVAAWNPTKGLGFSYRQAGAVNSILDQGSFYSEANAIWKFGKTDFTVSQVKNQFAEGGTSVVDHNMTSANVTHNMGKSGILSVGAETHTFSGTGDRLPDAKTNSFSYETKLNDKTSIRTEHSKTTFSDGTKETSSSNTIKTELTPRIGVSISDHKILRDGELPDETYRDYGFWLDFGAGIRLNWLYDRDIRATGNADLKSETTITGGEFAGGLKLENSGYRHYRNDGKRDRHLGNVNFSNVKPFQFGSIKDFRFYFRTDTERDFFAWKREILQGGASFAVGNVGLGFDYFSQIDPNGNRAIDRTVSMNLDRSGKSPLQASLKYGVRTLPGNTNLTIRDYNVSYKPSKNFLIQHQMVTSPIQQRNDALLGGVAKDENRSSWILKYQNDPGFAFDFNWNEIKRDNPNEPLRREARLNMTMWADNPSPLVFSYALQQWERRGDEYLSHAFGLTFNQKPGPNQNLSFTIENMRWVGGKPAGSNLRDWTLRLDYGVRF